MQCSVKFDINLWETFVLCSMVVVVSIVGNYPMPLTVMLISISSRHTHAILFLKSTKILYYKRYDEETYKIISISKKVESKMTI